MNTKLTNRFCKIWNGWKMIFLSLKQQIHANIWILVAAYIPATLARSKLKHFRWRSDSIYRHPYEFLQCIRVICDGKHCSNSIHFRPGSKAHILYHGFSSETPPSWSSFNHSIGIRCQCNRKRERTVRDRLSSIRISVKHESPSRNPCRPSPYPKWNP